MVKKLITLLAFIHAVLYSANTAAEQTQSLSQPLVNQLIVCNSVINGGESACSMYDDSYIQALGNMLIGDTQNWECEQNPNDPSCGSNTSPSLQSATILIIDVESGTSDYYLASKDMLGMVIVTSQPTPASLNNIVSDFITVDGLHRTLREKLSFEEISEANIVNSNNINIENLTPGQSRINSGSGYSSVDCPSAIAYKVASSCEALINGIIDSVYEYDSNVDYLNQISVDLSFSLANVVVSVNYEDLMTVPLVIEFEDGSLLVITIVFTGPTPAKSVDMQRSTTSQGRTFEGYFAANGASGIADDGSTRSSGAEARALFGRWSQCRTVSQLIGRDNEYLVTTGTREDGTTYVIAIEMIGSRPIYVNSITCDTMPVINPPSM